MRSGDDKPVPFPPPVSVQRPLNPTCQVLRESLAPLPSGRSPAGAASINGAAIPRRKPVTQFPCLRQKVQSRIPSPYFVQIKLRNRRPLARYLGQPPATRGGFHPVRRSLQFLPRASTATDHARNAVGRHGSRLEHREID